MKLLTLLTLVLIIFFVTTSCGQGVTQSPSLHTPESLNDILAIALSRRVSITRPSYDQLTQLTYENTRTFTELNHRPLVFGSRTRRDEISLDFAIYDTNFLFNILAAGYGPYIYFGGDKVFVPMRDVVIDAIKTQQYWCTRELAQLYYLHLSQVIVDGHLHIDGIGMQAFYEFFVSNEEFNLSENGFSNKESGLYVESIWLSCSPELYIDINDIFRLSMDDSGSRFFYVPVIALPFVHDETSHSQLYIRYTDNSITALSLEVTQTQWFGGWDSQPSLDFIQGIPVIAVRGMGSSSEPGPHGDGARQFLAYAEQLRDEDVLIIDLRGNMGGNGILHKEWLYMLTNENIPHNFHQLSTRSFNYAYESFFRVDMTLGGRVIPFDYYHSIFVNPPERIVPNNQLIIVLSNRHTASAAEKMIDSFFSMENTLIIGQNTSGAALSSGASLGGIRLPRSRIPIELGALISIFPDGHFQEGLGFAPDIWVVGDALNAAVGLIENHFQP